MGESLSVIMMNTINITTAYADILVVIVINNFYVVFDCFTSYALQYNNLFPFTLFAYL